MATITLDLKIDKDNKRNKLKKGALRVDRGRRGTKTSSAVNLLDKQGRQLGTVTYDVNSDGKLRIEWDGELQLTAAQPVFKATTASQATSTLAQPNQSTTTPVATPRRTGGCTSCGRRKVSA